MKCFKAIIPCNENIALNYDWEEVKFYHPKLQFNPLECHLFAEINNNKIKITFSETPDQYTNNHVCQIFIITP